MKMIVAVIRPEKLQAVKDGLTMAGVHGMTITDVRGRGEQSGIRISTRVGAMVIDELDKVRVEAVVEDDMEQPCVDAIIGAAETGHCGDGRIFVLPVERSIRIRRERFRLQTPYLFFPIVHRYAHGL